ncbi:hypothetical protein TNCV_4779341 [Trichonephila clavipes]|nr:hypothetical protein TNCV_4779341 [Trichonephila clavipes]
MVKTASSDHSRFFGTFGEFLRGAVRERRRRKKEKEGDGKRVGEREEPALYGEKGLVRDWSGKTMNAGGVENGLWTDCTAVRSAGYKCLPFLLVMKCAKCQVPKFLSVPVCPL